MTASPAADNARPASGSRAGDGMVADLEALCDTVGRRLRPGLDGVARQSRQDTPDLVGRRWERLAGAHLRADRPDLLLDLGRRRQQPLCEEPRPDGACHPLRTGPRRTIDFRSRMKLRLLAFDRTAAEAVASGDHGLFDETPNFRDVAPHAADVAEAYAALYRRTGAGRPGPAISPFDARTPATSSAPAVSRMPAATARLKSPISPSRSSRGAASDRRWPRASSTSPKRGGCRADRRPYAAAGGRLVPHPETARFRAARSHRGPRGRHGVALAADRG